MINAPRYRWINHGDIWLILFIQLEQPRLMEYYEVAVMYNDPQHQGDRRKKSHQCRLAMKFFFGFFPT